MSFALSAWASDQKLKALDKIVLMMIADRTYKDDVYCVLAHETLALDCGMSKTALKSAISRLEEAGYLRIERRASEGVSLPNRYYLLTEKNVPCRPVKTSPPQSRDAPPHREQLEGEAPDGLDVGRQATTHLDKTLYIKNIIKGSGVLSEFDFSAWPELPSDHLLKDWQKIRKAKRAPITQTAIDRMGSEMNKAVAAGFSVDECLSEAIESNWQGFKSEWMINRRGYGNAQSGKFNNAPRHQGGAIDRVIGNARARIEAAGERGVRPDSGHDDFCLWPEMD